MNDIQVLTICITLLGIFAASWFNNTRMGDLSARIGDMSGKIGDVKSDRDAKISDTKEALRAEMKTMRTEINRQFDRIEVRFDRMEMESQRHFETTNAKIDDLLRVIADHDQRISKIESIAR